MGVPGKHADKAVRARSFGAAADAYERARPGYPDPAVDWLVPEGARTVLDLGAGTGKLTRALVARGLDVIAVEPLPEMRESLAAAVPEVRAVAGTAEDIPLPDDSVDAITVAQAWHWVDPERASHTGLDLILNLTAWDLGGAPRFENHPDGGACVIITISLPDVNL